MNVRVLVLRSGVTGQSVPGWHPYGNYAAIGAGRVPGKLPPGHPAIPLVMLPGRGGPEAAGAGVMGDLGEMTCGELAGVAAELALGVLTGRERARAVAHLDACEACRESVVRLMTVAGELLALLPARDPPPGFETAVLARIGLTAPRRGPGLRWRRQP